MVPNLGESLIDQAATLLEIGLAAVTGGLQMFLSKREIQLGHGQQLSGAIMQIAAELAALFVPQVEEMAGNDAQLLLGAFDFGEIGLDMQAAESGSGWVTPDRPAAGNDDLGALARGGLKLVLPITFAAEDIFDLRQGTRQFRLHEIEERVANCFAFLPAVEALSGEIPSEDFAVHVHESYRLTASEEQLTGDELPFLQKFFLFGGSESAWRGGPLDGGRRRAYRSIE